MSLQLTLADLAVVLGAVTGLVGLWLRLSWRTRQEQARRETLVDVTRCLRPGSELVEHAADGTQLRITVSAPATSPPLSLASSDARPAMGAGPSLSDEPIIGESREKR